MIDLKSLETQRHACNDLWSYVLHVLHINDGKLILHVIIKRKDY